MTVYVAVDFHARDQVVSWCDTADGERHRTKLRHQHKGKTKNKTVDKVLFSWRFPKTTTSRGIRQKITTARGLGPVCLHQKNISLTQGVDS